MRGKDLNDRQAKGALSQAVTRIAGLTKKANESKVALAERRAMLPYDRATK